MAKRFKLRICRVISTTLQSCRSKDPSNLPEDPVPSFSHLPKISTIHFSHSPTAFNHHVSSAFISINCALPSDPPQFKWQKEDKWHVVAKIHQPRHKIYNSAADSEPDDLTFAQPPVSRRRLKKKKKNVPSRLRLSTSSADSGWFSSEGGAAADEEETETLVSSSPNSSSEFNQLHPIGETQTWPHRRSKKRASKRTKRKSAAEADGETPARLSMFKKLIPCTVEGKVKESFAIVKKSEDPYSDFKSSMMDMILEKQMFEQGDLEQLLQCFLSLNSRHYHGTIVEAFSEIWEAIFSPETLPHYGRRISRSVANP